MKAKETISNHQSVWDKAIRLVVYPRGAIKVEPAKRLIEKGLGIRCVIVVMQLVVVAVEDILDL